ncbi:MAG: ABC transporter ATP-binding protein, partial [Dehalococcoidia bacterium]|nr:ABC transporter ATP-binding protein [Dehalococcoidia bacterium]
MSDVAIHAENLGKLYHIGQRERYKALRDTLADMIYAPVRRIRSSSRDSAAKTGNGDNTIWALKDVSFDIESGEVVGIIGRNGAGKSTLLKILSRITEPTEGFAEINGRVGSLLEVGTGFHPELTGRENIYLNGAILGMRKTEIDRKFDEIVAFAEVERFIDTPVKHYSSGMGVRLAFAVAAHLEPEILLIDEVLAVGDAAFQKKCLGKMEDVAKGGRTVLFVSHNMASIVNLCPRAILLDAGKVVMDGYSRDVVQHYIATAPGASGEVVWDDPTQAPGNDIVRLHAVRIFQDGIDGPTADVDIAKEVIIQ